MESGEAGFTGKCPYSSGFLRKNGITSNENSQYLSGHWESYTRSGLPFRNLGCDVSLTGRAGTRLLPDSEFLDQLAIAAEVVLLQVVQQALTLTYELHQPAMGGEIFFIDL